MSGPDSAVHQEVGEHVSANASFRKLTRELHDTFVVDGEDTARLALDVTDSGMILLLDWLYARNYALKTNELALPNNWFTYTSQHDSRFGLDVMSLHSFALPRTPFAVKLLFGASDKRLSTGILLGYGLHVDPESVLYFEQKIQIATTDNGYLASRRVECTCLYRDGTDYLCGSIENRMLQTEVVALDFCKAMCSAVNLRERYGDKVIA